MVKSRVSQVKVSRTWGHEEHNPSHAGSVVMPDPVCGSRGAKTANINLRGRSQEKDSHESNARTSTTRGNLAPSPSAAAVSKLSRDVIRGPLKELSENELNTGIVHVGFSSRKAASVKRPSTSAKARQSIFEAQGYEWGQQNAIAGSSPSNENTFSVQRAMDLAQQAVDAFKTPPGKALSARQSQELPGPSISGSARSVKFSMHDVMTPGITGKLSHRIDTLFDVVNHSENADCPMTPYVLSSCSCATSGAELCSLHGPRASSVKSSRSRPRSSDLKGTTTPGFKDMKDAMSPVPESTSMLSMSQSCIISPDCSMQLTPPQQSASSSSSQPSQKAGAVKKGAKRQDTSRGQTKDVDKVGAGVGEGGLPVEEDALAGKKPVRDIIVMVKPEWREDNGFQVWEVVERNASGEPLRGVELLPLQLLGSQSYGSFSFASADTRKRSLSASKDACGKSGFHAPADFREVEVTVGKRKYQVVKLTKEQKQVTKLHEELSKRQKPKRGF